MKDLFFNWGSTLADRGKTYPCDQSHRQLRRSSLVNPTTWQNLFGRSSQSVNR